MGKPIAPSLSSPCLCYCPNLQEKEGEEAPVVPSGTETRLPAARAGSVGPLCVRLAPLHAGAVLRAGSSLQDCHDNTFQQC